MPAVYTAIVVGTTLLFFLAAIAKVRILFLLGLTLIVSQLFCITHIMMNQPSQIVWLCNVVVFMQIFLLFKFNQRIFDMSFFFAWTGCFIICFMPNNPYAQMLKSTPIFWMTYWIKHLVPLVLPIYYFRVKKKKLSRWSIYYAAMGFLIYTGLVYLYNLALNQNIFYLIEPAPFMKSLGPYYFLIAIVLGYCWFSTLYVIANLMGWVKSYKESRVKANN